MCVYIYGRITFKILGVNHFVLIPCFFIHSEVLTFIAIFIYKLYYHFCHYYYYYYSHYQVHYTRIFLIVINVQFLH